MTRPARPFLLDGDFLQDGLLLDLGTATLNLEIDNDKKTVTVARVFARGRRFKNRHLNGQTTQKVLTVVGGSNCTFKITLGETDTALSHTLKLQARLLFFRRAFTPGSRGTRHSFRPAKRKKFD